MLEIINTPNAPAAIGPYSQGVVAGSLIFVSGQIPLDPVTGDLVTGDINDQTAQVIRNIQAILQVKHLDLKDVIKTTVFLSDIKDFPAFNSVYAGYFAAHRPARSTVQVGALPKGAKVEIEVIAVNGNF